jgi:hypothetical protein
MIVSPGTFLRVQCEIPQSQTGPGRGWGGRDSTRTEGRKGSWQTEEGEDGRTARQSPQGRRRRRGAWLRAGERVAMGLGFPTYSFQPVQGEDLLRPAGCARGPRSPLRYARFPAGLPASFTAFHSQCSTDTTHHPASSSTGIAAAASASLDCFP